MKFTMPVKETNKRDLHEHSHSENRFAVIPTDIRLNAASELTGKGVTIAFIDSGFYGHPDLLEPVNRILCFQDVTGEGTELKTNGPPENFDWHGTQTCVSAAGNGHLSNGMYRGLASNAHVVLVKAGIGGHITEENIARGLRWVIDHKDRFNIRIVSLSLGGDADVPSGENLVDQLAEEAVQSGIVVIVAAGNSGCTESHKTVPPANAPSVITVGGYDDKNELDQENFELYCSSFGPTADGILKPEIIAPAIWVAAPILPNTSLYRKAEVLSHLFFSPDYLLKKRVRDFWREDEFGEPIRIRDPWEIREDINRILKQNKIVSTHYQHVDGTSFAAPVVASVVAHMIEANPNLSPTVVKQILVATSDRIANASILRQGYGMLNAKAAIAQARQECHTLEATNFFPPRVVKNKLIFFYHDDYCKSVSLAAEFNNWEHSKYPFVKDQNGIWKIELEVPPSGIYRYKFVVDGDTWVDDPGNGLKELDNYGGFNSILKITGND